MRKSSVKYVSVRTPAQIRGVRSQLQAAINGCDDGANVTIDLRSARNAVEVCEQAEWMMKDREGAA